MDSAPEFSRLITPSRVLEAEAPMNDSTANEPTGCITEPVPADSEYRLQRRLRVRGTHSLSPIRQVQTLRLRVQKLRISISKHKARVFRLVKARPPRHGTASSSSKGIVKHIRRVRSYSLYRSPSYYVTSRSHRRSTFDQQGPRLIRKPRIARVGETRTPFTNASARYGLSRSYLERHGSWDGY